MKKALLMIVLGALLVLTACGNDKDANSSAENEEKKEIKVGFGVGTYEEQFRNGILPILEKEGYKVEIITFSQNMQVNPAMEEGSLDASVFQSTAYMKGMNEQLKMNMTDLAFVPSAPQGLYSTQHTTLDDVQDGTTVAFPNDPVNQERAARILEDLGWVKVAEDAGTTDFNVNSILPGDYDIEIKVLDPAQILVSLDDVDYGVVNGNYIANADRKITEALKIEDTPKEHRIIVSALDENKESQWAKDLAAAYESQAFEDYINGEGKYDGFILPEVWENN